MSISEQETIIKRILPYLERRGYNVQDDLFFEEPTSGGQDFRRGFIDISVRLPSTKGPVFLIEAKRDGTKLTGANRSQVLNYGRIKKCLFVCVTNGTTFEILNTKTAKGIYFNNASYNHIPRKEDLIKSVLPQFKKDPSLTNIVISADKGLPYRPSVPLKKLNYIIQQCHNTIRKIEKNEEHAFADFSKLLFLKLLEEKWDREQTEPLYSYFFHELAQTPKERADQVKTAIEEMLRKIKVNVKYSEVIPDDLTLKKPATFLSLVQRISAVNWSDCNVDSKGTAFEYFVRATLKGKKLGQYFTPRPVVQLMLQLGKWKLINRTLEAKEAFRVLDPACGTGGFLVLALRECLSAVEEQERKSEITRKVAERMKQQLKEATFFGIDANEGVASAAKMNMIIAGDGHNNIRHEDSLELKTLLPVLEGSVEADLILTNPPFGTSEAESLSVQARARFAIPSTKGQSLFLQRMVASVKTSCRIVTVIDDGVLNTTSYTAVRRHIMTNCRVEYVISLPPETFKPNKINVKSSILVLQKRETPDDLLEDTYPISFVEVQSLGYDGSGTEIKGFDLTQFMSSIEKFKAKDGQATFNDHWIGYGVKSSRVASEATQRLDCLYWNDEFQKQLKQLRDSNCSNIKSVNQITTKRGKSPSAADYVGRDEGFALVVKAGSSITKLGTLLTGGDYVEEATFQGLITRTHKLEEGDVLLASTGDGTLGKCCVYRNQSRPAIADGHVTVIRVDQKSIFPEYLCDYLRRGLGADQVYRLSTGSTGLIEITPEDVDRVLLPTFPSMKEQKRLSSELRKKEGDAEKGIRKIEAEVTKAGNSFYSEVAGITPPTYRRNKALSIKFNAVLEEQGEAEE